MTFAPTFKKGDRVRLLSEPSMQGTFVRMDRDLRLAIVDWDAVTWGQRTTAVSLLRHAPVLVVGPVPPKPPAVCPWCGAETYIDNDCETIDPKTRARRAVMAVSCTACEFIEEVQK